MRAVGGPDVCGVRSSQLAASSSCCRLLAPFYVFVDHIEAAIAQLDLLGALEHKDDQLALTPIGRKMAAFPLEPKFAKVNDPSSSLPFLCLTG